MTNKTTTLAPGVIIEEVAGELMVISPVTEGVIKLSGEAAEMVRRIQVGLPVDLSSALGAELVSLGIVAEPAGMSRRGLLTAGAIGAGAGIAVLAMPSVAAAASDPVEEEVSGGVLGGSYDESGSTRRLFIIPTQGDEIFPFSPGDQVDPLRDVTLGGASPVSFTGTVSAGQVTDNPLKVEWIASGGNLTDVFVGSNRTVQGKVTFEGLTYTVLLSPFNNAPQ